MIFLTTILMQSMILALDRKQIRSPSFVSFLSFNTHPLIPHTRVLVPASSFLSLSYYFLQLLRWWSYKLWFWLIFHCFDQNKNDLLYWSRFSSLCLVFSTCNCFTEFVSLTSLWFNLYHRLVPRSSPRQVDLSLTTETKQWKWLH